MTTPALRSAWAQWCSFADALDLSDDSPDCSTLHGRLFRLCGSHSLRARELRAARDDIRSTFESWLGEEASASGDLEQLRHAMTVCVPGWRALLGLTQGRLPIWDEVERIARTAGLPWPAGPFWASPLHVEGRNFDLLAALRGRNHAESLAFLDALLQVLNHPRGAPLFEWARTTTVLRRPAEALQTAALFRDMVAAGALRQDLLAPLGWTALAEGLLRLCQDICLCLLVRLNEPMPAADPAVVRPVTQQRAARPAPYRRAVPEPLPVEPYFRKVAGSEAFLRAIAEEPLEDAHRLAFADWLEDEGHAERAQFIRLQCELERLPDHPLARRRLAEPITALFTSHGADWVAGLPPAGDPPWSEVSNFRRGLLECVEVRYEREWPTYARLFEAIDLRALRTSFGRDLLEQPWLGRLVSLELTDYLEVHNLQALAGAPALAGLVHLRLNDSWLLTAAALRALVEHLTLPALTSLEIVPCRLSDEGARALAASKVAGRLRRLRLRGSLELYRARRTIGLPGLRALASSAALAGLEHLDVSGNNAPAAGVESIATSPFLGNLTTLVLEQCAVGNKGAKALASSPFLKSLVCLDLKNTGLLDEGARALARSANLANLTVLDLGGNTDLGDAGLRALAGSPHLARLRALSLSGVPLTVGAVEALASSPHWANLDTLDLSSTGLGAPAAGALVASPYLNNLAVLDLKQDHNTIPAASKAAVHKRWPFARL